MHFSVRQNFSLRRSGATAVISLAAGAGLIVGVGSPAFAEPVPTTPACAPSAETIVCQFGYTGAAERWTAPPGVTKVTATALGAQGGSIVTEIFGGLGGSAAAELAMAPGADLLVTVGGAGGKGSTCDYLEPMPESAGGFNGGANGGSGCATGGGGGGATDVRTSAGALADRLLVAGGGGGASNYRPLIGAAHGGAGGLVGGSGGPVNGGGAGATQSGGGSGVLGQGSAGVNAAPSISGGGGGGGGYFGGAGGGPQYGGGGGSSFGPVGTTYIDGTQAGNGAASIGFPLVVFSDPTADSLTDVSATLKVTVDPNGREGLPLQLAYGTDPASLTSVVDLAPVSGTDPVVVSVPLTGLTAETAYAFQVMVPGDATTSATTVTAFTTLETPAPAPTPSPTPPPTPAPAPAPAPTPVDPAQPAAGPKSQLANTGGANSAFGLFGAGALAIAGIGALLARKRSARS